MRWAIRIVAILASIAALWYWYQSSNLVLVFTATAFFLTFLGTFIKVKKDSKADGISVTQESGAFSTNNQSVNINEPAGRKED